MQTTWHLQFSSVNEIKIEQIKSFCYVQIALCVMLSLPIWGQEVGSVFETAVSLLKCS